MTHTPGPWQFIGHVQGFASGTVSGPDPEGVRYRPLANVLTYDGEPNRTSQLTITSDERDANAKLVAAAPDLLRVAQAVADHFINTTSPLGEIALAAINKATQ